MCKDKDIRKKGNESERRETRNKTGKGRGSAMKNNEWEEHERKKEVRAVT